MLLSGSPRNVLSTQKQGKKVHVTGGLGVTGGEIDENIRIAWRESAPLPDMEDGEEDEEEEEEEVEEVEEVGGRKRRRRVEEEEEQYPLFDDPAVKQDLRKHLRDWREEYNLTLPM